MSDTNKAIVVGVGPAAGLGGALCTRLAREGLHVFAAGRTPEKVETLARAIRDGGGRATAVAGDTTSEQDVRALFDRAEKEGAGHVDLVIYNAGNAAMGELHDMEASFFEQVWRVGCFGGFLVGREAVRRRHEDRRVPVGPEALQDPRHVGDVELAAGVREDDDVDVLALDDAHGRQAVGGRLHGRAERLESREDRFQRRGVRSNGQNIGSLSHATSFRLLRPARRD